jgi:hypothetical protein
MRAEMLRDSTDAASRAISFRPASRQRGRHFGAGPIRLAWSAVVFPRLVLNYAGQAAFVLEGAPSSDNIFYRLCPSFLLVPLVVL